MNAPIALRQQYRLRIDEISAALDAGDDTLFEQRLAQLLRERESGLFVSLAKLTRQLHQAIFEKPQGASESGGDDACARLDHAVRLSEQAAHKTLDLVDRSRECVSDVARAAEKLERLHSWARRSYGMPDEMASLADTLQQLQTSLSTDAAALRNNLSQLAQTQEYQDLSGQLIKRVVGLVQGVESALLEMLRASGGLTPAPAAPTVSGPRPMVLEGPAVPGLNSTTVSQQDADALLSSLGF